LVVLGSPLEEHRKVHLGLSLFSSLRLHLSLLEAIARSDLETDFEAFLFLRLGLELWQLLKQHP
jgi:hypothetical protein